MGNKLKIVEKGDIVLMRRDFKILHLVLFFLLKNTSKLLVRD